MVKQHREATALYIIIEGQVKITRTISPQEYIASISKIQEESNHMYSDVHDPDRNLLDSGGTVRTQSLDMIDKNTSEMTIASDNTAKNDLEVNEIHNNRGVNALSNSSVINHDNVGPHQDSIPQQFNPLSGKSPSSPMLPLLSSSVTKAPVPSQTVSNSQYLPKSLLVSRKVASMPSAVLLPVNQCPSQHQQTLPKKSDSRSHRTGVISHPPVPSEILLNQGTHKNKDIFSKEVSYGTNNNKHYNHNSNTSGPYNDDISYDSSKCSYSTSAWKEHSPYTIEVAILKPGDVFGEECIIDYSNKNNEYCIVDNKQAVIRANKESMNNEFQERMLSKRGGAGQENLDEAEAISGGAVENSISGESCNDSENEEDLDENEEEDLGSLCRDDGEIHFVQGEIKVGGTSVPKSSVSGHEDKKYPVCCNRNRIISNALTEECISRIMKSDTDAIATSTTNTDSSSPMYADDSHSGIELGIGLNSNNTSDNNSENSTSTAHMPIYYSNYTATALTDKLRVICINKPEAKLCFNVSIKCSMSFLGNYSNVNYEYSCIYVDCFVCVFSLLAK